LYFAALPGGWTLPGDPDRAFPPGRQMSECPNSDKIAVPIRRRGANFQNSSRFR
jgi:hypothetical protein